MKTMIKKNSVLKGYAILISLLLLTVLSSATAPRGADSDQILKAGHHPALQEDCNRFSPVLDGTMDIIDPSLLTRFCYRVRMIEIDNSRPETGILINSRPEWIGVEDLIDPAITDQFILEIRDLTLDSNTPELGITDFERQS